MKLDSIRHRLQNDYQLASLTMLAGIAAIGVSPFAIFRLLSGNWSAFALDAGIELGIFAGVAYAWRSGDARRASLVFVYFDSTAVTVATFVLGEPGIYWMYPALVSNFLLADRRHAMFASLLSMSVVFVGTDVFHSRADAVSFAITMIVMSLLTYTFAYRTARQHQMLETLATKDALTGVFNRRALLEELERIGKMFARDSHPRGLLVLDLDFFKRINDELGHIAGDQALIRFARLLERSARPSDRLYRYGGEEFVFLVNFATIQGLTVMSENLRGAVAREFGQDRIPVTVSIGGAVLRPAEPVTDWFARADAALYQAKNAGRNRSIVDPNPAA